MYDITPLIVPQLHPHTVIIFKNKQVKIVKIFQQLIFPMKFERFSDGGIVLTWLFIISSITSFAQTSTYAPAVKLYSENLKSEEQPQNILSETRLRFHPYSKSALQPFVGAYKNPFSYGPTAGLQYLFGSQQQFQLLAEQRLVYSDKLSAVSEGRFGFIFGDWREWSSKLFLESYGESILIPRLNKTPVSILWTRFGYRERFFDEFYIDPYLQLWARISPTQDLGQNGTELRPGVRLLWAPSATLAIGLHIYNRKTIAPVIDKRWEGLFVIQGEF